MRSVLSYKLMAPAVLVSLAIFASIVYSHCQIPCGIYDDPARFVTLAEHIATIEKSMNQINELSQESKPNFNQIVRWVQNKDSHADELSEIVTYYFMAQRIKPADKADAEAYQQYVKQLTLLHQMLVYSMKAKQTTDLANVEKLRALLAEFRAAYLGDSGQKP
jgi:nickel superoxide dismutase